MKKRLLSLLLTVCMVVMLFTGLAVTASAADTIKGYEDKTLDECRALGINDSMIHVDFMIGTEDMNIDAKTRDGKTVPIFRNGNWAF